MELIDCRDLIDKDGDRWQYEGGRYFYTRRDPEQSKVYLDEDFVGDYAPYRKAKARFFRVQWDDGMEFTGNIHEVWSVIRSHHNPAFMQIESISVLS